MSFSVRPKNHYDAVVLGAGVAGLGVALEMAKESLKVLLVSKFQISGEASRAAAGILDPFLQISDAHHPLLSLTLPAFQDYEKNVKMVESETGQKVGYKKTGMIYIPSTKVEENELKKRSQWQKLTKVRVSYSDQGLEYPDVGRVYPELYMNALITLAKKKGVKFFRVVKSPKLRIKKDRYLGLTVDDLSYASKIFVNATGSWWDHIFPSEPVSMVSPVRGQIVLARSKKVLTSKILHSLDNHYLVPWNDHLYLCGSSTENAGYRAQPTVEGVSGIWKGIKGLVGSTKDLSIVKMWAGLRPKTPDGLPILGKTQYEGVYAAGGYYRSGILFGHYAGKLLAKSIVSGKIPSELIAFNPLRFKKKG